MKFPPIAILLQIISHQANAFAFTPVRHTSMTKYGHATNANKNVNVKGALPLSASTETETETEPLPVPVPTTTSPIAVNPLVANVKVSATVQIFSNVKQMQAEGIEVTSLCVGEPDFPPPQAVLDAATAAIASNDTRYTAVTGTAKLRQAIAHDLLKRKNVSYDPNTEIVVGNGAKQCVYQGILATAGPGDAVLIPAPFWPSYPEMVALAGAKPIILPTKESDGYLITPEGLRSCLEEHQEDNIKCMILCNPSNPTGGVHNEERLKELANVLEDYPQIAILADEIYERLVYIDTPADEHVSFASISPNMYQRTMTINGFSKAYAMTGMRLGYMAAPQPLAKAATTIQSQVTSCAGSISQAAGVAALEDVTEEEMEANVKIMRNKRDYVIGRLEGMEGVTLEVPPKGAFYVLPDVSPYYDGDDTQLCLDLLEKKRLALVPGSSFGAPGTVRISYATSLEELDVAMNKLQEFLEECNANDNASGTK